jgi:hypothetical protein
MCNRNSTKSILKNIIFYDFLLNISQQKLWKLPQYHDQFILFYFFQFLNVHKKFSCSLFVLCVKNIFHKVYIIIIFCISLLSFITNNVSTSLNKSIFYGIIHEKKITISLTVYKNQSQYFLIIAQCSLKNLFLH